MLLSKDIAEIQVSVGWATCFGCPPFPHTYGNGLVGNQNTLPTLHLLSFCDTKTLAKKLSFFQKLSFYGAIA